MVSPRSALPCIPIKIGCATSAHNVEFRILTLRAEPLNPLRVAYAVVQSSELRQNTRS